MTQATYDEAASRFQDRLRVVVWLLAGLALAAGPLLALLDPSTDVLIISGTACVLLVPVFVRAVQGAFDPFEPIFIFAMAYGVMFVVRPAAMLVNNHMSYIVADRGVDIEGTFRTAILLGLLGAIGFVGGYFLRVGDHAARRIKAPPRPDLDRVVVAACALWAFGGLVYGLFLLGAAGSGSGVVHLVVSGRSIELTQAYKQSTAYIYGSPFLMVSATLILFGVGLARSSWRLIAASLASTLLLFLLLGPSGSRTILFPLVLGLGVIYYTNRGTRPRALSLVAVTLVALFVSALLLDIRDTFARQAVGVGASIEHTVKDPLRIFDPITTQDDAAEVPALSSALTVVPSVIHHQWGTGVARDFLARPIPRQLWPAKPIQPKEQVIATLWPDAYDYGVANPEFSVLLSFYIDGGEGGALLGMFVYGLLASFMYRWYRRNEASLGARVLFASALPFIVSGVRDTPVDTFTRVAFVGLPMLLIFYFAVSPERTARMRPLGARLRLARADG